MRVALQQLGAEREQRGVGDHVIFQNNSVFHVGEEPSNRRRNTETTPQVAFLEESLNVAWPIDGVHQGLAFSDFGIFANPSLACAINCYKEVGDADLAQPLQQYREVIWPIESNDQDRFSDWHCRPRELRRERLEPHGEEAPLPPQADECELRGG